MKKIEINPSYIYEFDAPKGYTEKALEYAKSLEYQRGYFRPNSTVDDYFIHQHPEMKEGAEWVFERIKDVARDQGYDIQELMMSNSQLNKTEPKEWHTPHNHANCLITCVWYLNDCEGETIFYRLNEWVNQKLYVYPNRPRGGSSGAEFSFKFLDWHDEEGNCLVDGFKPFIYHKQPTVAGKLMVFPSSMLHLVNKNRSDHDRYVFSCNTFPTKFGQKVNQVNYDSKCFNTTL